MALSETNANYRNQAELQRRDRVLGEGLDDLASQVAAIRSQGNFGQSGSPSPPHPVTKIGVTAAGGFATITLTHNNAPPGCRYVIDVSTSPNFTSFQRIDNGTSLTHPPLYLKSLTLYFRAAAMFPASELSAFTYFATASVPTPTTF